MEYYKFDLGSYRRVVSTESEQAQEWFRLGFVWTYGYNHEEAVACFEKAVECDESFALAYWGIAYAIGPNYNKPWEFLEAEEKTRCLEKAQRALDKAKENVKDISAVEQALIDALNHRYPHASTFEECRIWNDQYANAMRDVFKAHPDDLDVCALFVESLMNRTPWKLWNLTTGKAAEGADTEEAVAILEETFKIHPKAWEHPGLLHMYIHLMEMSPYPERALCHGDVLCTLVPDSGHLVHMSTHIDLLCGDYHNVVSRNRVASIADEKYLEYAGANNFYTIYRCHNYHFELYGAMFLGQFEQALKASEQLEQAIPIEMLESLGDWMEAFIPMKQHVLVRFGKWQDILDQALPSDPKLYSFTTAILHYARTIALSNLKRLDEAHVSKQLFLAAKNAVPESRMIFNNTCRSILEIAQLMLCGELDYHEGNLEGAFENLRKCVNLDDNLPYDEPWGWMQPPRHALGALLMEQGMTREAEMVYRADLGLDETLSRPSQHHSNVWSLHGLHECLVRRGETAEVKYVKMLLDKAVARATVPIKASCFCRSKCASSCDSLRN